MTKLDLLCRNYQRLCDLPWGRTVPGPQRVWVAVYDKEDERRLRLRLDQFAQATAAAGHRWHHLDLSTAFADWLSGADVAGYAEAYFANPELLDSAVLADFRAVVVRRIGSFIDGLPAAEDTVLALTGVGGLFGFLRVSELLPHIDSRVPGRLLVFFPGTWEDGNNYKLFEARDGWNYLAIPITSSDAEGRR